MTPSKITLSDCFSAAGVMLGIGFLAKVANGEQPVNWKFVLGIASGVISVLLIIVGFLITIGLDNNQKTLEKIDNRQQAVIKNQGDMKADFVNGVSALKEKIAQIDQRLCDHLEHPNGGHKK